MNDYERGWRDATADIAAALKNDSKVYALVDRTVGLLLVDLGDEMIAQAGERLDKAGRP